MYKFKNKRWSKHHNKKKNWPKYNNQLVIRGEFYFHLEFLEHWYDELREMNKGKRGAQFKFPYGFINWMAAWHQLVDYRGLEGIGRMFAKYNLIPYFGDYTTL